MSGFLDMPRIGILNPSLDLHMFLDYELFDPMLICVYISYERTSNIIALLGSTGTVPTYLRSEMALKQSCRSASFWEAGSGSALQ